jgi:cation diffusion facilitator family transporter
MDEVTIQKNKVARLSVISNSVLVVFKAIVGIAIGSVSVLSEAIHSGMDLVAAIIALVSVRISGKSYDEDHAFGHGKVENLSAFFEALLIFAAAVWIVYEAVEKLINPKPLETPGWGVLVMGVSGIANWLVSRRLFTIGKKYESAALIADAWHLRTDVYTSLGVMGGLAVIFIASFIAPGANLFWLDPVVAIAVAVLIVRAAWHLTVDAIKELMDTSTSPEELNWIKEYLKKLYPIILSAHRYRTRRSGADRFIDFHIVVRADMTVNDSHTIGDDIVAAIKEKFPNTNVIFHVEPCDGSCSYACISGCLLTEVERKNTKLSSKAGRVRKD